jgi:hypothetical protein
VVKGVLAIFAKNIEFVILFSSEPGSRCILLMETSTPENIQEAEVT